MKNSNLLQRIGIVIIILSWSARLIGKFLSAETAEMLSDVPLISFLGIGIWTVGFFKKENDKKKKVSTENSSSES
ncbi:hypothetical protein MWU78_16060 [Arenibacter sp. F26102]|uniref:hypothetical protein n=1 Tax=Arenibacter sp. F26102 TaxID=2926416 RepID=UPI001FF27140|nr:hypothetical protein [Arenibacter sp. F26102]MCK0147173.1 hypothetical protein [Arenibacter sp. F26102]